MPSWSQRRTVTSTSQYQGGLGLDIQEMGSRPTVWRTVLARPKDEPLKMSIFNGSSFGLVNTVRHTVGLDPISWISSPNPPWYWLVLVTVRLWLQLGIYMIIFIAGLQEIPRELYEAALVDGARRGWQTFRHITFPMLRNATIAVLLLNVIAAFQAFDEFFNIMSGGNQILARPPLVYLYNIALSNQNYGYGSAGAIILTVIIVIFTLIQGRFLGFGRSE